jgi:hypothetical protein
MRFALLSIAAAAIVALDSGSASAQWIPGPGHGGHLDFHNGHFHYHNGRYMSGPLYSAFPTYGYSTSHALPLSFGRGYLGFQSSYPSWSFGRGYYSPYSSQRGYGPYYRRW